MATVSKTRTYSTGSQLTASNYNDDRDEIIAGVNSVVNAQISASAAIDATKISGTAVTLTGSETLTNKTLTSPTVNTPTVTNGNFTKPTILGTIQTLTTSSDGGTITFNMAGTNVQTVTLAGNRTLAVSNVSVGQPFIIRLIQDGTGSRTVTWFSTIKWSDSTVPTLTTTASKIDSFGFICTATDTYDGYILGQNLG